MSQDEQAEEPFDEAQDRPLGLPKGSVRSLMSLGVVVAAGAKAPPLPRHVPYEHLHARPWRDALPRSSYECLRTSGEVRDRTADAARTRVASRAGARVHLLPLLVRL